MKLLAAIVFLSWSTCGSALLAGQPVEVVIYDRQDYRGALALQVGGQEVATVKLTGSGKDDLLVTSITWPDGVTTAGISGELRYTHYRHGPQMMRGSAAWQLIDLAPLTKPLRDERLPAGERLRQFVAAQRAFEQRHPMLLDGLSRVLEPGTKATRAEIAAAEKRLGYLLPAEHARLLEDFGAFPINDSSLTPAAELNNAFDEMWRDWETPREELDKLPAETKALLRSSTLLYTEVGDGYGGLLYQPPQTAAAQPTYWWIHQDEITDPDRLKNQDGSLKNYSQTLLWLLAQQVIEQYDQGGNEYVFIDRTSPAKLRYRLIPEERQPTLEIELWLEWAVFE